MDAEWRHRTENGAYSVRLTGIDQLQPDKFLPEPYGAGNLKFRGSAETKGKFYLNPNWTVGWNLTLLSDRFYLTDYRLLALDTTQYFFQDVVSQVYLRGQAGRGFFDLTGYSFQPTGAFLDTRQDPTAVPTFDYHRTFSIDPVRSGGIGGEATVELNAANINREEALYQSVGAQRLDSGLQPLSGVRNRDDRGGLRARKLPAARHRRRLHARDRAGVLGQEDGRSLRRSMEALRLRAGERRSDEPFQRRILV